MKVKLALFAAGFFAGFIAHYLYERVSRPEPVSTQTMPVAPAPAPAPAPRSQGDPQKAITNSVAIPAAVPRNEIRITPAGKLVNGQPVPSN
jgi:hypothetical protein